MFFLPLNMHKLAFFAVSFMVYQNTFSVAEKTYKVLTLTEQHCYATFAQVAHSTTIPIIVTYRSIGDMSCTCT